MLDMQQLRKNPFLQVCLINKANSVSYGRIFYSYQSEKLSTVKNNFNRNRNVPEDIVYIRI